MIFGRSVGLVGEVDRGGVVKFLGGIEDSGGKGRGRGIRVKG